MSTLYRAYILMTQSKHIILMFASSMVGSATSHSNVSAEIVFTATNVASVLICILAVFAVYRLALHRKIVYRLALYQVLASLVFAFVEVFQIAFIDYDAENRTFGENAYDRACNAIGFLILYSQWVKLLFTAWVTFHLFCFAVFHKNLRSLEVLYVVTSLLVPLLVAIVPLLTDAYGINTSISVCYIFKNHTSGIDVAAIEKFSLWYGPSMAILLAASFAMVVIVSSLVYHRLRSRPKYGPVSEHDRFWKAFKQLLPLAAFPILFLVFIIPVLASSIDVANNPVNPNIGLALTARVCISLWSAASGLTLLIHISVVRYSVSRRKTYTAIH